MQLPRASNSLSWPLSSEALEFARQVSQPLYPDAMADRVFDDAIAVVTVHNFLASLGISSSYQESALQGHADQTVAKGSDLNVEALGRLECRAVDGEIDISGLRLETLGDRIGYVFVSFDLEDRQSVIHGFLPNLTMTAVSLEALRPVEYLLQHLYSLATPLISMTRWLSGVFEPEWEAWDRNEAQASLANFRGADLARADSLPLADMSSSPHMAQVQRAKTLTWEMEEEIEERDLSQSSRSRPDPVVMVIAATQLDPLVMRASVQIHPAQPCSALADQLELIVLDDLSQPVMSTTARPIDNYLELQFKGLPGETFQVRVGQKGYWVVENFQL